MTRKKQLTTDFRDTMALAGWLFADLLLGLAMLFLVSNTQGSQITPVLTPTPYPTYTPLPTYRPYPTPVPTQPSGLDQKVVILTIPPSRDKISEIEKKFKNESRKAGFVLIFGYHPKPIIGNQLAGEVKALLLKQNPNIFNKNWTVFEEDLHYITLDSENIGRVDVKVYFLLGSR